MLRIIKNIVTINRSQDGTARIWSYNKQDMSWSSIICKYI